MGAFREADMISIPVVFLEEIKAALPPALQEKLEIAMQKNREYHKVYMRKKRKINKGRTA
jgi:hypothetical protein